ncbi:flagellar hook-length control protein FliK [Massilia soli]|uniref:Flagellar hook-length control protein FliK n=1 Tax=Massilia soli TaxID=2792854 RepID=A0ABS7SRQ8_9BURK|nr:flagellar hook-length control protein FliK [Massilia soli]MBZ2208633.1 flagellar hook-length control protein FliK [Massilia soli]
MNMMISTPTPGPAATPLAQGALAATAAPAGAGAAAPVTAFADWMGLDLSGAPQEAAAPADTLPAELQAGADGAAADTEAGSDGAAADGSAAQQQDRPLAEELPTLAAMMPAMPMPMPVPLQMPTLAAAAPAPVRSDAAPAPAGGGAAAASLTAAFAAAPRPAAPAPAALTGAPMPATPFQIAAKPAATAAAAPATAAIAADAPAAADAPSPVAANGIAPSQPAAPATSELKLAAAAPAAWQQPLREALGERLQLQLSRNIDQAVIRLDPPNLGRIEIAIRHMAGSLEVNISATHSEVVRQLNTISETMRSDLASRQFTEVAVNVTGATRTPSGAQQGFDQQGRQRQQDGAPDETDPGRALAEAGNPSSTFSLNSRESSV